MVLDSILGNVISVALGVILLVMSAEYVVDKLIKIAKYFNVSNTFIGLTVMSVGTSLPEIGSHVVASIGIITKNLDYKVASSTVLGANIGSDVIQQTFILGLVIFMVGSLTFSKDFLKRSYSLMIGTTLMTLILGWDGTISRFDGILLLSVFIWYMYFLYKHEEVEHKDGKELERHLGLEILLTIAGMAVLLVSSVFVLRSAEFIVHATGVGGSLIGVLTLGVASALPEFFTAIEGVRKKASGISVGTLIGSNITNPLLAIGLGGLISTYYVPRPLVLWDLPVETITALVLLIYLLTHGRKLGRKGAVYLMALYFAYAIIRIMFFAVD